jgi:hypothetical protein
LARPIFSKSLLGNVEIFAVIGIFTLYALEFAGIDSFSRLIPDEHTLKQNEIPLSLFSLEGGTDASPISVKGSTMVIGLVLIGGSIFFIVLRRRN